MNKATSSALIILAIGLLVSVACSPTVEPGNPLLPPGFEEALLPDVDLNGYVYLRREEPFHLSASLFKSGNETSQSIGPPQLGVDVNSISIFVGPSVDAFGGVIDFSSEDGADIGEKLLEEQTGLWSRKNDSSIALVPGQDVWDLSLRSALEGNRKTSLEQRYPEVSEIIKLLPENPPSRPIAAGFLRTSGLSLEALGTKGNIGLANASLAFSSIKASVVVFAVYANKEIVLIPGNIDEDFFKEAAVGAVFVTRSEYPAIIVSLALNTLGGSAGMVKTSIGDLNVKYMKVQDLHAFIVNRGSILFAAIAPDKDYAEELMLSAVK